MRIATGLILAAIGGLFIYWGHNQSDVVIYRLLAGRSRGLWGDRVHGFYQVSGVMMIVVGAATAITR